MANKKTRGGIEAAFAGLALLIPATLSAQNPPVTLSINAGASRHAISPLIYGVAFASKTQASDLNILLNRSGGNTTSTYNWLLDASNTGNDYFFESIPQNVGGSGASIDNFISDTHSAGAQPIVTVPLLDWIAAINGTGHPYKHSFSISKYGPQKAVDQYETDAGNGKKTDGTQITGNDPADAYIASTATTQQAWVQHLLTKWGNASGNGVRYYAMDNEPSLWQSTHIDVHPVPETQDEIYGKTLAYAGMIKSLDPNAQVIGFEEWNWPALFNSGKDQTTGYGPGRPDRAAHGGTPYGVWFLQQMHTHDAGTGVRLLDVFSIHYYPQNGEFSNNTDAATQGFRNRSTRSLWDPNYKEESWMQYVENGKPMLIPQIKNWVATYYPGTKTAITEYNWGADGSIGGATAQADVLGIFGREGLDMATRWTCPTTGTPVYNACKLYRNYDGSKSAFGDTSVAATAPNPDNVAVFAATRSTDSALTIMVINKYLTNNTPVTLSLANFPSAANAQVWQLTGANAIAHLADTPVTGNAISASLPPQSITLFVVPITDVCGLRERQSRTCQHGSRAEYHVCSASDRWQCGPDTHGVRHGVRRVHADRHSRKILHRTHLRHKMAGKNVAVNAAGGAVSGVSVTLAGGDADSSGTVDIADFGLLVNAYGGSANVAGSSYDTRADFNGDGTVDIADFGTLVNNYGASGDL